MLEFMTTAAVLVALIAPAMADQCDDKAVTQQDINECARRDAKNEDVKMYRAYEKRMQKEDEVHQVILRASQLAWSQYREHQCSFESRGNGSSSSMVASNCYAGKARARTTELEYVYSMCAPQC